MKPPSSPLAAFVLLTVALWTYAPPAACQPPEVAGAMKRGSAEVTTPEVTAKRLAAILDGGAPRNLAELAEGCTLLLDGTDNLETRYLLNDYAVREGVPMVPERSLLQRSDGSVVFVLNDDDRAERRNVQLGIFRDAMVEVVSGVAVGERVIVRGMSRLVDGSAVDVRLQDGSKAGPPSVADATDSIEPERDTR